MRLVKHRALLGAVLAPWTAPVLILVHAAITNWGWPLGQLLPLIVAGSVIGAYAGSFLVGLPVVYVLTRFGVLSLLSLSLSGGAGGVLVYYFFSTFIGVVFDPSAEFGLIKGAWGASLGAGVALVFGLIARSGTRGLDGIANAA
jgi:hypothetical protein